MRYQWGYGVGHAYSHADAPAASRSMSDTLTTAEDPLTSEDVCDSGTHTSNFGQPISSEIEHTLENIEDEELDVDGLSESDGSQSDAPSGQDPDDESEEE